MFLTKAIDFDNSLDGQSSSTLVNIIEPIKAFFANAVKKLAPVKRRTTSSKTKTTKAKSTKPTKTKLDTSNSIVDSSSNQTDHPMNDQEKKKKKFLMPTPIFIVLGLLIFMIAMTWVPHTNWYDSTAVSYGYANWDALAADWATTNWDWNSDGIADAEEIQAAVEYSTGLPGFVPPTDGAFGVLDFSYAIYYGFMQSLGVIMYLMVLGAFIEMVLHTKSMDAGISSLLKKANGKEIIMVPILFVLFSLCGSLFGMQEETLAYFAILIPFLLMAGFNTMTAIVIMMVGTCTGIATSITNPFATQIAVDISNDVSSFENFTMSDTMVASIIMWVMFTAVGAGWATWYAYNKRKKLQAGKQSEADRLSKEWCEQNYMSGGHQEYKFDWRRMLTLIVFALAFLTMLLWVIPWDLMLGYAPGMGSWFGYSLSPLGYANWFDYCLVFLIAIGLVMVINKIGIHQGTRLIIDGAKGMVSVSLILAIARSVSIVMTYSGLSYVMVDSIASAASDASSYGFMFIMFVMFIGIGFIIPSTSGSATLIFPIVAPIVASMYGGGVASEEATHMMSAMVLLYTMALGIVNLLSPIQAVTMGSCQMCGIEYKDMVKTVSPYAGAMFGATIAVIIPVFTMFV